MAQEQENVQLIQRVLSAIGQGDLDGVLSSMSEDVEIYFPGPSTVPFTGTYRGHAGVGQFAKALGENVVDGSAEVRQFVAQNEQVVVIAHEHATARPTGRSWESHVVLVWTVRNGKVTQLQEFQDTSAIESAFRT